MKIIISPAKKMKENPDILPVQSLPSLIRKTEKLKHFLKNSSREELQQIWNCNDKITDQNIKRLKHMELKTNLTPAIFAYEGLQYQHIASEVMDETALNYLEEHLRILSGFYGVLRPMDGVTGYRLEMQSKLKGFEQESLYDFWGDTIYRELTGENGKKKSREWILDLASKEYSRCIEKYADHNLIHFVFGEFVRDKIVEKGTFAKMARGEMVRYLAEIQAQDPQDAKGFDRLGYRYSEEASSFENMVFIKNT